jgi:hypothetical protein
VDLPANPAVVLSPRVEALFRVVPPALYLALAMTEKHEKAERMRIMKEMGCSEVEAAIKLAKDILPSNKYHH